METYFGKFDERLWKKMKALVSLEGKTIIDWIDQKIRENIDQINVNNYQENENYKRKKVQLEEDLHQKIKTVSYLQECNMNDIIQTVIEKEIEKSDLFS